MDVTSSSAPEPEERGKGWKQEINELEALQQFAVESNEHTTEDTPTLTIVSIYHKTDRELWFEISRHLDLLRVPGHHLDFRIVPLTTNAEPERRQITSLLAKTDLQRARLVLLIVSVDAITALLQHSELCAMLCNEEGPTILPINVRPLFWQCPYTQLDPIPKEAVTLYANRDVACTTIAKSVHWFLMDAIEESNDAE